MAVLGAGLMGAAAALRLARRGCRIALFDRAAAPLDGASRWNEGKIHLGYLYAGDPTLATARRVVAGGVAFRGLVEDLVGTSIAPAIAGEDDIYAVHRDSVVAAGAAASYYERVAALAIAADPGGTYLGLGHARPPRRLSAAERAGLYDDTIVDAFAVSERSVSTSWIADRFAAALTASPRIELRLGAAVLGVRPRRLADDRLDVVTAAGADGPYDAVVNALWEGRLAVDATAGVAPPPRWSHRYRLAAFLTSRRPVTLKSTVVATGPFGDVKNYDGRHLYVSWYPTGLVAEGTEVEPPPIPTVDRRRLLDDTLAGLGAIVPGVAALAPLIERSTIAGGWVYAAGDGSLADPAATLHRRDRAGLQRHGRYLSVDTGKYSLAPWLADRVVDAIL
ncbi:MAG: FAD-dependent oxidoreductase [Vicinamibacterales bacterium]